jgi:hypothetical protein
MFDFDPRDQDSDHERNGFNQSRGSRDRDDPYDRDDDWRQPDLRHRDRDGDAQTLGRGPGNDSRASHSDEHARDRRDDARWPERDRDERERAVDPRDAFVRHIHLPRGLEREIVRDRDREYTLRGSESRCVHGRDDDGIRCDLVPQQYDTSID